jgi:hypothetical protein
VQEASGFILLVLVLRYRFSGAWGGCVGV